MVAIYSMHICLLFEMLWFFSFFFYKIKIDDDDGGDDRGSNANESLKYITVDIVVFTNQIARYFIIEKKKFYSFVVQSIYTYESRL